MAKVGKAFHAHINLNKEKGGGWLAKVMVLSSEGSVEHTEYSSWKNASAAKRWIKEKVKELTPRKSVPLTGSDLNEKDKPQAFAGVLTYKVDA